MPIILPANCRNVTAGALRQLKQQGHTTASKGLWTREYVDGIASTDFATFFRKTEPAGAFMDALEQSKQRIEETSEAIRLGAGKMVETAKESNRQMADMAGKMRAQAENLGTAIDKLSKVAARADFAKTVETVVTMVDAMERLSALEERGLLRRVMHSMAPEVDEAALQRAFASVPKEWPGREEILGDVRELLRGASGQ